MSECVRDLGGQRGGRRLLGCVGDDDERWPSRRTILVDGGAPRTESPSMGGVVPNDGSTAARRLGGWNERGQSDVDGEDDEETRPNIHGAMVSDLIERVEYVGVGSELRRRGTERVALEMMMMMMMITGLPNYERTMDF